MAKPELWYLVPSAPGLLASSHGRILVVPKFGALPNGGQRQYGGIARKGSWDGERYIFQWQNKTYKVARLVCEAFNGAPPDGMNVCMHLDENSRNNLPGNLKWGTQKENLNAPPVSSNIAKDVPARIIHTLRDVPHHDIARLQSHVFRSETDQDASVRADRFRIAAG